MVSLGASEADIALSKHASSHHSWPLGLWADPRTASKGFELLQERSTWAELLLSQVQTLGARCACMHQAAILKQQHKQKHPEAPEEGREAQSNPKIHEVCILT